MALWNSARLTCPSDAIRARQGSRSSGLIRLHQGSSGLIRSHQVSSGFIRSHQGSSRPRTRTGSVVTLGGYTRRCSPAHHHPRPSFGRGRARAQSSPEVHSRAAQQIGKQLGGPIGGSLGRSLGRSLALRVRTNARSRAAAEQSEAHQRPSALIRTHQCSSVLIIGNLVSPAEQSEAHQAPHQGRLSPASSAPVSSEGA